MADLAVFRDETRNWLEENCPPEMKKPMTPHGMTCLLYTSDAADDQ